jgi:DNA-formamidopyrimidine glycosylase
MPESPEVLHLTEIIQNKIKNKYLESVKILKGRYITHGPPDNFKEFTKQLPMKCLAVQKKGKVIFIYFENNWCLISKLGMSGWWFFEDEAPEWLPKYENVIFQFKNIKLIFTDFRNFGTLKFTNDKNVIEYEINKLAPDITDDKTTFKILLNRVNNLSKSQYNQLLEDIIIDQKILLSGIGNYLKAEILYDAKINPLRKVKSLNDDEWKQIFNSTKKIIKKMLKALKSNDPDKYMDSMKIYSRKIDPLGNKIKTHKTKTGRTTYYVSQIQK